MQRFIRSISIACSVSLAWVGLLSCGDNTTQGPVPGAPGEVPEMIISIPRGAMDFGNHAFVPNPATVTLGGRVTWVNQDTIAHTATSDSGVFDSGTIAPGESWSWLANASGTFSYHCRIHPTMQGSVTVRSSSGD